MAWRNIWRNSKRTLITSLALILALTLMIWYSGLTQGLLRDLRHTVTQLTVGDYQIHQRNYLAELSLYDTIDNYRPLIKKLNAQGIQAAPRWYGYGLLANDQQQKTVGVEVQAVDLALEPQVTAIAQPKNLLHGRYLDAAADHNQVAEIVLAKKVAQTLAAKVGDEMVLVTTGSDGSIGNEIYRVVGILNNIGDTFDRTRAIISVNSYTQLFSFNADKTHELALKTTKQLSVVDFKQSIQSWLPQDLSLQYWGEVVPLVYDMFAFVRVASTIVMLIIYMSAGLVILNSILMMVFERIREFGLMRAMGCSPQQVIGLVMGETFMLTLLSALIGVMLGWAINHYMVVYGLDLSRFAPNGYDFSGTTLMPILHSIPGFRIFVKPLLLLFFITTCSAIYPAWKAVRLLPVQALYRRG